MEQRVIDLVEKFPNDALLGEELRKQYWDFKNRLNEYKGVNIFESPDGGKSVYSRPFGGEISERKLVSNED